MSERKRAKRIKMIIMDVDGTLTDGSLLVMPDGEELKSFNVKDGTGIVLAHLVGLKTAIITGKISEPVKKRAEKLQMTEFYQGILNKKEVFEEILKKHSLKKEEVAYIGDDVGDYDVIKCAGFAGAVADAHPTIKEHSHFICTKPGGKGAVREFIEFIFESQNKWPEINARFMELKDIVNSEQ